MPKQHKLNPGTGAKCSLITRFAYAKRTGLEKDHRTTCILTKMQTIALNRKQQICFFFEVDGTEYYAAKRYFTVEEEGDEAGFFFPEDAAQRKKEREEEKKNQEKNTATSFRFLFSGRRWSKNRGQKRIFTL
jgi:hypothetical protein